MKTNLKLVAGSVAGLLTVAGLVVGGIAWANAEESAARPQAQASTPDGGVATIPMPSLEHELATTTPTPRPLPQPTLVEEDPIDPYAPTFDDSGSVRVRRLVIGTGIRDHEPTGAADELVLGDQTRYYAFVDAVNETGDAVALRVTFEPEAGESAGHVSLDVPAHVARYRTWAWTRHVYTPGRWNAVVRGPDGHELARRAFDVVE